jgi:hypothetical protein
VFFNQHEAALALDDRGDGDVGFPSGAHGGGLCGIALSLMQVMDAHGLGGVNFR